MNKKTPVANNDYARSMHNKEIRERRIRLDKEFVRIDKTKKRKVANCPCEKDHKGLQLTHEDGTKEIICPAFWHRTKAFYSARQGEYKKFSEEFPYEEYMEGFKK